MATRREVPADVASALDRVPEARDRFAALPAERQAEWLDWIDGASGGRDRADRIDELIRRLVPSEEEEVVERGGTPFSRYWWLWLLLLLLLVVGGLLAWYFLSRGDDKTTVPNVIGLRGDAAAQRIDDEGLKSVPRTGPSNRPQGVVFAQKPGAGTQLDKGQTVTISISAGSGPVPDVTGLKEQDAVQQLENKGFKVEVRRVASSRPKGTVLAQAPAAGVTAAGGTTVRLTVSSGVKPVSVPSLVGQSQGDAVNTLTGLGLQATLNNVSSAQPPGTVVAQKPPAGTEVDKGSKVTLNVSTGSGGGGTTTAPTTPTTPETTTTSPAARTTASAAVPSVVGLAPVTALRRLNLVGLRPTLVYVRSSRPANSVLRQSPTAGQKAERGTRVRVEVSTGPNPEAATAVPDVTGQDQAAAASAVRSAGFRIAVLNRPTSGGGAGTVVEQQPRAGANIPGGSLVAIFIGRSS